MLDVSYNRFGGVCAVLLGAGSFLYAVFFLILGRQAGDFGKTGSWVILAVNGLLATAAYVALYERTRDAGREFSLWGLLLGFAQGLAMMANGVYQAVFGGQPTSDPLARGVPSWADPKGLGTFLLFGIASFVFARVFLATGVLPRWLGYLGMVNGVVLVILFFANVFDSLPVILVTGGLTSVILTPVWWVLIGRELMRGGLR
jgi:hypothetical protein